MSLSPAELAQVADELSSLTGARVQKVSVLDRRAMALELRLPGRSAAVLLDAGAGVGRAVVIERRPVAPRRPLAFQGLARAHLSGARLDSLTPRGSSLTLAFSTDRGARSLVLEIDRRGGELVLLEPSGSILGVSSGDRLRDRGLGCGDAYCPPPERDHGRSRFAGKGPGPFPVCVEIEARYGPESQTRRLEAMRAATLGPLRAAIKRLRRTLGKIEQDRARVGEAQRYRELGDLLKPHLSRLRRGDRLARVLRYTEAGPTEVAVPLLPELTPHENLERYYHLHRRLTRGRELVEERHRTVAAQLESCEALAARAQSAEDVTTLETVEADRLLLRLPPSAAVKPTKGVPEKRKPYREFTSAAGRRIWVGRSARDNDTLTFRLARGNDLWLHARGQTGSHVVVPGSGAAWPDGETLLDAATLAAHFSRGRSEAVVDVAVTRRKYVQKAKGAAPGAVRFTQDKNVVLRLERARLERLLQSET